MIIRARLIKHSTEDGLMEIWEQVPLGRIYFIDIDTKREMEYLHVPTGKYHKKIVVKAADPMGNPEMLYLPFECLEIIK